MHRKKKVRKFPVPSRDVTSKLSLGGNNDVITELFLPRGSLVSDIPAGDGKLVNLFLRCGFLWIDLKNPSPSTPSGQGYAGGAEVLQSLGGLPLLPSDEEGAARQGRPSGRDPVLITWTSIV